MSTALVAITPTEHNAALANAAVRPRADFLAQLIATLAHAPQTRERRRAAPQEAIAAYDARDRLPALAGYMVSRSL